MRKVALVCLLLTSIATAASAQLVPPQNSRPSATAKVDTIPAPRDLPYPGTMPLTVDASDVTRCIYRIHQTVPVAGRTFDPDALKTAITNARVSGPTPQLLINSGDLYRTVALDWHGGLRYPRLEKVGKGEGTLDALLAPR